MIVIVTQPSGGISQVAADARYLRVDGGSQMVSAAAADQARQNLLMVFEGTNLEITKADASEVEIPVYPDGTAP